MITVESILLKIPHSRFIGNPKQELNAVIELDNSNQREDVLCWCSDRNMALLSSFEKGTVICSQAAISSFTPAKNCNYIIVENPRRAFREVLETFFAAPPHKAFVSPSASVHPSAKIGSNVFIGHNAVIEENCVVGDDCYIGYNTVILSGTSIGNKVKIGSNNTIGTAGFGYEKDQDGNYRLMPHIGGVEIRDQVEIGSNNCIDRGVIGNTLIGENVKIDNLIHIAHGVKIGRNSLIIANAMIGGSTVIGENVWVAPSASLLNKITIGNNAVIGMGAVVIRDVEEGAVMAGNPAKKIK